MPDVAGCPSIGIDFGVAGNAEAIRPSPRGGDLRREGTGVIGSSGVLLRAAIIGRKFTRRITSDLSPYEMPRLPC
jgi:hypothetical protein